MEFALTSDATDDDIIQAARMESAARSLGLTTPAEIAAFARGSTWCMSEVHKHFTLTPKGPPLDEETIRAYMRGEYR